MVGSDSDEDVALDALDEGGGDPEAWAFTDEGRG